MKKYNLVLWGTGDRAEMCLRGGYLSEHHILGFIDSYKKTDTFHSFNVYTPSELGKLMAQADYLVILNRFYDEIMKQCMDLHIGLEKIIITDNIQGTFFTDCFSRLEQLSEPLYQRMRIDEFWIFSRNLSDRVDETRLLGRGKYASRRTSYDYMTDYFRYRTFEFVAREIKERNIHGALAELGVFQGAFASLINETFPERKLYLFDTFESFDPEEFAKEQEKGRCGAGDEFRKGHAKTSEELVISRLPRAEFCVICKGLFPSSVPTEAENEKYAFVSLDVDLEESTYQGLKFFYPRLAENGYIFLHDYTTHWLQGVKVAVCRYEKDNNIILKKIPIADRGGTLIITK